MHSPATRLSAPFACLVTALLMGMLVPNLATADSEPGPLTLDEVVTMKRVTGAWMSPAGDSIAYRLSVPRTLYEDDDGSAWSELHVVDLEGQSRPYFTGKVSVTAVAWSVDGEAIYFVGRRDSAAPHPTLFRIALKGGEAVSVFEAKSEIQSIHPSPDGNTLAFLATDARPETDEALAKKGFKALVYEESVYPTRVWMLDLDSTEVQPQEIEGSASGLQWAPDGAHYAAALAPTPLVDDSFNERDIYLVETASGEIRNPIGSVGKLGRFDFSPDGNRIAWISGEDINDPSPGRLYVASARGGEKVELVPDYAGHVEDFAWIDDDRISWLGARGVWTEQATASLKRIRPAGDPPTGGPVIRSIDSPRGRRVAAAIADSATHPPEVYLLRPGAEPQRLTDSNPFLAERLLARQEVIRYRARDGLELEAILIHPLEAPRGGRSPLIMFIHGGPESHHSSGWMSSYAQPAQVMAAQGYAVVYPNYRGSTGRGIEFSKLGQNDYAAAEFDDIVDAKQHLVESGLVFADKVGISGGSYGGYASMWAASALSEHFAASVAFVGISNQLSKFGTSDIPQEMFNVHSRAWPWDDWMWMLERSPVFHADKVRTPLLIMAGDKDPRVHPSQSLEMYRHVKLRTDTPVRLVFFPGEVHGNRHTAAQYDYALRFERWMNHYLTGPGGAPPPFEIDHAARLEKD